MFTDESFEKKAESFASDYEEAYDEMLDEMGAAVLSQYSVSRMLRETDPIAYNVGMNDYESSLLEAHQDEGDDSPYEDMFDDDENLTPTGEKMLKEMYDEMLDESGVESLLNNYDASRLLKETDPIAYRVGLSDYESSMEEDDRNVYRDMAMQRKGMMAETFGADEWVGGDNGEQIYWSHPSGYEVIQNKHGGLIWIVNEKGGYVGGNYSTIDDAIRNAERMISKRAETFEARGNSNEKMSPCCEEPLIKREGIFCESCGENYGFGAETFGAERMISKRAETFEAREKKIGGQTIVKNPNFPSRTSLKAYMKTSKGELRKLFGNPNFSNNTGYNLVLGGKRVTIYDHRQSSKRGMKYFNIGSSDYLGPIILAQIISAHRGEKVHPKEITPQWLEDKRHYEKVKSIDEHPDLTLEKAMSYSKKGYYAETFGAERQELCIWGCGSKVQIKGEPCYSCKYGAEESGLTRLPSDEPNFDPQKADRNKDGKISSWERTVGNKVAKGIREGRKTSSKGIDTFAEPFEDIGISKPYARLGVIAAGITALAIGVKKLRK